MLNLKKKSRRHRWKEVEKAYLKENAGTMSDEDIAKKLNKTIKAVRETRYRMGIKKKPGRGIIAIDDGRRKKKSSLPPQVEDNISSTQTDNHD